MSRRRLVSRTTYCVTHMTLRIQTLVTETSVWQVLGVGMDVTLSEQKDI